MQCGKIPRRPGIFSPFGGNFPGPKILWIGEKRVARGKRRDEPEFHITKICKWILDCVDWGNEPVVSNTKFFKVVLYRTCHVAFGAPDIHCVSFYNKQDETYILPGPVGAGLTCAKRNNECCHIVNQELFYRKKIRTTTIYIYILIEISCCLLFIRSHLNDM